MKKLFLFACVVTLLTGCGGGDNGGGPGGGGPGGGPGGGGPGGRTYPTFSLGAGGVVQTTFLSGMGRSLPRGAAQSQTAVIRNVRFQNSQFDYIPTGENNVLQEMNVQLDGYTINAQAFGVQFPIGSSSLGFAEYLLEVKQFIERQNGSVTNQTPEGSVAFQAPNPFEANLRVFPGRVSNFTVRLDDSMLNYNFGDDTIFWDDAAFRTANFNPIYNKMISQFSDYVCFDISGVSSKPQLHGDSTDADRVYFSGDGYGYSRDMGSSSVFELLDPINVQNGKVTQGPPIGPPGSEISGANLFILDDTGPALTRYTSIIGTWKNFGSAISSSDTTVAVAFPTSREAAPTEANARQQFVLYKTSGGNVTALWYGSVFYNVGGNPSNNIFKLYPVDTIDDAVPANEVQGTLSNLVKVNGTVRRGDWDVTGVPPGIWPFGTSGGFGVYRR
ncbi:MAG: hypothetical protein IT205_09310 [Fimbriimonadaceae bacterium]|nr:hypothetical protein [Fimbriimonadaceae bacterium]